MPRNFTATVSLEHWPTPEREQVNTFATYWRVKKDPQPKPGLDAQRRRSTKATKRTETPFRLHHPFLSYGGFECQLVFPPGRGKSGSLAPIAIELTVNLPKAITGHDFLFHNDVQGGMALALAVVKSKLLTSGLDRDTVETITLKHITLTRVCLGYFIDGKTRSNAAHLLAMLSRSATYASPLLLDGTKQLQDEVDGVIGIRQIISRENGHVVHRFEGLDRCKQVVAYLNPSIQNYFSSLSNDPVTRMARRASTFICFDVVLDSKALALHGLSGYADWPEAKAVEVAEAAARNICALSGANLENLSKRHPFDEKHQLVNAIIAHFCAGHPVETFTFPGTQLTTTGLIETAASLVETLEPKPRFDMPWSTQRELALSGIAKALENVCCGPALIKLPKELRKLCMTAIDVKARLEALNAHEAKERPTSTALLFA